MTDDAIRRAVKSGRIDAVDLDGRQHINPQSADRQWQDRTDPSKHRHDNPAVLASADLASPQSYMEAKTRRESALAEMAEIELAKAQGRSADADKVRAMAMTVGRLTRDAVLGLPFRLAPELASLDDPVTVEERMTRALRDVLDDVTDMTADDIERAME